MTTGGNQYVSVNDIDPDPLIPSSTIYQELLFVNYHPGDILIPGTNMELTNCGECAAVPTFRSQRQLFSGFRYHTVRQMLAANLRDFTSYTVYRRDFSANTVVLVTLDAVLKPRDSIIAILPSVVTIERYLEFLSTHRELIPTREV